MSNRISDFMAWLGGADTAILKELEREKGLREGPRFAQMGGVLLTTASIATLSMFFALHDGVKISLVPALLIGASWGLIIFNLDRFLVLSMAGVRNVGRLVLLALPRLALASVLALVISTPVVLRVFASDINEQLHTMQLQNSARQAQLESHTQEQQQLNQVNQQIARDRAILAGNVAPATSPQLKSAMAQVATLKPQVSSALSTMNNDYRTWQCELAGQIGADCTGVSGKAGDGPRARTDQQEYEQAKAAYTSLASQLQQAKAAESTAQKAANKNDATILDQDQAQARRDLAAQLPRRATLQAEVNAQSAAGTQANQANTGILAQLQALSAVSAKNPSLNAARLTVLALFFLIEILPVTVKVLLNLGEESAHDARIAEKTRKVTMPSPLNKADRLIVNNARRQILQDESEHRVADAKGKMKAEADIRNHMRQRQVKLGIAANDHVAKEMKKVLEEELRRWSDRVHGVMAGNGNGGGPGHGPGPGANGSRWQTREDPGYGLPSEDML